MLNLQKLTFVEIVNSNKIMLMKNRNTIQFHDQFVSQIPDKKVVFQL
jgi:hypothetical protein